MLGRAIAGEAAFVPSSLADHVIAAAQGAPPDARVLMLAGPAHAGKTAALVEFARRCGDDAFIVSLTEHERSLPGFMLALVQAIAPVARGAQLSFNAMQARLAARASVSHVVTWLCSHIERPAWIIFDNVEVLNEEPWMRSLLAGMVARAAGVRWIFAGRSLASLPVEVWLPRGVAAPPLLTPMEERAPVSTLLDRLDENAYEQLSALAPLRTLEPRLIEAILGDAGTMLIEQLRKRCPAIFDFGVPLRLHRDVRQRLLDDVRARGSEALAAAVRRCANALEAYECYEELLQMYLRMGSPEDLEAIMARRGLALADAINVDTLDAALRAVSDQSSGVRSLQAILASRRGQFDLAENLFESAAQSAPQPLAAQIAYAYGCDLLQRNRGDAAAIFERLLDQNVPGAAHQSEVRSALAHAYALGGRHAAALEQIKFALHVLSPNAPETATVDMRAAYVYLYAARDLVLAERFASAALAEALQARAFAVAASSAAIVATIARERDRPDEAIAALDVLADCGMKLGSVAFQAFALVAMLEYYVEAGERQQIGRIVEALRAFDITYESLISSEALVASEAMQLAWRGEFDAAYRLLAPTCERPMPDHLLALRESQLAFLAVASGDAETARAHVYRTRKLLETIPAGVQRAVRARIFQGIAASAIGETRIAEEAFAISKDPSLQFPRLAYVREAAYLLHRLWEGDENNDAVARAACADETQGVRICVDVRPGADAARRSRAREGRTTRRNARIEPAAPAVQPLSGSPLCPLTRIARRSRRPKRWMTSRAGRVSRSTRRSSQRLPACWTRRSS